MEQPVVIMHHMWIYGLQYMHVYQNITTLFILAFDNILEHIAYQKDKYRERGGDWQT